MYGELLTALDSGGIEPSAWRLNPNPLPNPIPVTSHHIGRVLAPSPNTAPIPSQIAPTAGRKENRLQAQNPGGNKDPICSLKLEDSELLHFLQV